MAATSALRRWLATEARRSWFSAVLIILAGLAAYHNTFSGPLAFDDLPSIKENISIRHLWPVGPVLSPASHLTTSGRPIVNLTLALNYAISGEAVWSYHAFNLFIHLLAGLVLFGVVRRTLSQPVLRLRFGGAARPLATASAILWLLHPLQTESVTYLIQRAESLAGLFCLLTLYGFIRATESPPGPARSRAWLVFSFAACLLGMATKEVMVSVPLLVLAYDWIFLSSREPGGFRATWRQRHRYYLALAATWILLAVLVAGTGNRSGTAGLNTGVSPVNYALTQCRAIALYLQLALWPNPLVIDYGVDVVARARDVWPQAVLLVLLFAGTLFALWRRSPLGFVGLWFFAILAPSSSLVPIATQTMAEHRMYLPLAGVVVLAVLFLHRLAGRAAPVVFAGLALALGAATVARNHDYRTGLALWTDTVQKRPGNERAHFNLAIELVRSGDRPAAIREYEEALRLKPVYVEPHVNLFALLLQAGRLPEARVHAEAALRLNPDSSPANNNFGHILFLEHDVDGAIHYFTEAVRLDPDNAEAHNNLGYALLPGGAVDGAIGHFRRAVALKPDFALAHRNLGGGLLRKRRIAEARVSFETAVWLRPEDAEAQLGLGNALAAAGRYADAVPAYQAAVRLEPANPHAHFNLGMTLHELGHPAEAIGSLETVLRLDPENAAAAAVLAAWRRDGNKTDGK